MFFQTSEIIFNVHFVYRRCPRLAQTLQIKDSLLKRKCVAVMFVRTTLESIGYASDYNMGQVNSFEVELTGLFKWSQAKLKKFRLQNKKKCKGTYFRSEVEVSRNNQCGLYLIMGQEA